MAYKFKPDKITKPGIYEIRVYEDKKLKDGTVKHKYKVKQHLKRVNVFLSDDKLVFQDGANIMPVDSLWGEHNTLQRPVKERVKV